MIPVVVALKSEIRSDDKIMEEFDRSGKFCLVVAGMGKRKVKEKVEEMERRFTIEGFISAGFAGGLVPDLRAGQLVLVKEIGNTSNNNRVFTADTDWREKTGEILGMNLRSDFLITANFQAGTRKEKEELREVYGADLVDMESYWIAERADDLGVPFLGLRVVYDEFGRSLPPFSQYEEGQIRVDWPELAKWITKNPARIFDLLELARLRSKCANVLTRSVSQLVRAEGVEFN